MSDTAIAIVGAACRFPGAAGLEAFWRLLIDGVDAVTEIGADRFSTAAFHHPRRGEPGKTYSFAAGLIDGIDLFDPGFFGISPREAAQIDPQQRLLLELAWHAIEDAGILASRLAGSATGVYVGASSTDYADLRRSDPASGDAYFATGATLSILANRISHIFDLRGPSLVVDTACSSSLVALHEACAALRAGRVEAAIVGGVNLLLSPYPFIGFAQAGLLSQRGRCYAFDARADGYVRGEGGAVVVLKPLERALADGDPIRAVIRGTGVNASGHTQGLSLPSAAAQAELLRRVYREAGIAPDALAFFEMHGTGTPAGDPVEAAAVGEVLGQARAAPLPIGSVKTNIGHLEPASGMAGLLKAALALERGVLPASLNCETPNRAIPFAGLNLRVAVESEAISGAYAGVNSFGFGGTNAHAILAAPPTRKIPPGETLSPALLISARSPDALRALVRQWRETLATTSPERRPLLIRAAARRRDQHPHRLVALGADRDAALADFIAGKANPTAVSGTALDSGKLAFVFSGNGAQWLGMGSDAYRHNTAFRDAIATADRALRPHLGWSVAERIAQGLDDESVRRADIAQPLLFAIQTAIVEVLRGLGVTASGYLGHSVGEIAAAWAAGALSLDDAARVVAIRSRHQERTRGAGRMAALALGKAEAGALIAALDLPLDIAAVNSDRAVTVAGPGEAVAMLGDVASRRGIACRELDLDFAFHSRAMAPIRDGILGDLAGLAPATPVGDLISTVTGERIGLGVLDAAHWWRNIRDPVRFAASAQALIADGYRMFIEIGPHPVLQTYLRDALKGAGVKGRVLSTLDRKAKADPFPAIAAALHIAGHDLSGAPIFDGPSDPRGLPLYPWQRERYWFAHTVEADDRTRPVLDHPLLGFRQTGPAASWVNHLDTVLQPLLADHRIEGTPVLPAAAIVDMALAAAQTRHPDVAALELGDVELLRPMGFAAGQTREVRAALVSLDGDWQLTSHTRLSDETPVLHATARLGAAAPGRLLPETAMELAAERVVDAGTLYCRAARLGLDYGPRFRSVRQVAVADSGRAEVTLDLSAVEDTGEYLIHPVLLDGALQGLLGLLAEDGADAFLPRRFGRVRAYAPFGRAPCRARLQVTRRGARSAAADIALYDRSDELVAELSDCVFARVAWRRPAERLLRVDLVPAPFSDTPAPAVLDRIGEIAPRLAAAPGRDTVREEERALLLEALVAAIAPGDTAERFPSSRDMPGATVLWRTLLAEAPEMVAELALLAVADEGLPGSPRDGSATDILSIIIEQLRTSSPPAKAGILAIGRILDEITAHWPQNRAVRVRAPSAIGLADSRVALVADGPCDIAIRLNTGRIDVAELAGVCAELPPGGLLLAVEPLPNPLWDLVGGGAPSEAAWREALAASGFIDIGTAPVATGPWPVALLWARAPAVNAAETPAQSLGLVAGDPVLAASLRAAGHRVTTFDPEREDGFSGDAVIFAPGAEQDPIDEASRLLPLFARVAARTAEREVPLWLVTSGAQQPGGSVAGDVLAGALWGFGRTLINEVPGLVLRLIDLPVEMPCSERAREIATAGSESEIVWTGTGRHVLRLRRGLPPVAASPGEAVAATCGPSGGLDRLGWVSLPPRQPGPGEIEIDIAAAGLNFRDVMWASGMLPEEALSGGFAGAALGLECAGTVRAVGAGVTGIAVGDRVAGFAPQALASQAITRADAVIAISPGMSFAAAATLPVAFVTAGYALDTLARLQPGEYVLIHAASGGVGLAALQIAKRRGAIVIATAGSAAKRAFLRLAGADHVADSRSLGFVDAVRAAAGGAGVDVVLNSLSGEAMAASLGLLKPFGRFVELGKRDIYENRRLPLRPLRQNISYFAVDIDRLPVERPALAKALLDELSAALIAGEIRPLAHRIFAFAEIADAFRLMQAAGHIGKIVLVPDGNAGIALTPQPDLALRRDGAYVVTGGLGGFGYRAARWLAEHGAGAIALIGRRGPATPGTAERIVELEGLGAAVSIHAADVGGDAAALAATLGDIRGRGVPIRGVIHAAANIDGGMAEAIDADSAAAGLRAKLGGAMLLDALTQDDPLELFWLFSSATSLVGAPGQGLYVAANHALEALARRRRAEGRPALAIAWGAIADAGHLAERTDEREALTRRLGTRAMPADIALDSLPTMAASGLPVVGVADMSHPAALPILATPLFEAFRDGGGAVDEALLDRLGGLEGEAARELLQTIVAEEAARILRLPADEIDHHRPLADLGMDSLMGVELRLAVESRLRLDLPLATLADGASIAALAARLDALRSRPVATDAAIDLAVRHEPALDPFALGGADAAEE